MKECPEGVVHEDSFKDIYAKFFPHGSIIMRPYSQPPSCLAARSTAKPLTSCITVRASAKPPMSGLTVKSAAKPPMSGLTVMSAAILPMSGLTTRFTAIPPMSVLTVKSAAKPPMSGLTTRFTAIPPMSGLTVKSAVILPMSGLTTRFTAIPPMSGLTVKSAAILPMSGLTTRFTAIPPMSGLTVKSAAKPPMSGLTVKSAAKPPMSGLTVKSAAKPPMSGLTTRLGIIVRTTAKAPTQVSLLRLLLVPDTRFPRRRGGEIHDPNINTTSFFFRCWSRDYDSSLYAHYVFKAFDVNSNGAISFRVSLGVFEVQVKSLGSVPAFSCRESGKPFCEIPSKPDRDSELNLPVVGSLAYYKSSALDNAATEAD
uniref:EF-hand domain-containing protein n=1 Tax=Timema shepardi TaxID=629360 RepID=A0A7R9G061_TIMSH|nr:unnamed protein product [Timema shepardi]